MMNINNIKNMLVCQFVVSHSLSYGTVYNIHTYDVSYHETRRTAFSQSQSLQTRIGWGPNPEQHGESPRPLYASMVVPKQMVNWPTGRRRGISSSKELQRYSQQLQTLSHSIQKDGHMRRHHMFWQLKVVFLQLAGRGVNLQGSASLVRAGVQLFRMSPQPHGAEKHHHPRLAAWRCVIRDLMLYIFCVFGTCLAADHPSQRLPSTLMLVGGAA